MPDPVRLVHSPVELAEGEMGRTRDGRVYVGLANRQYIEMAGQVAGRAVVQPMHSPSAMLHHGSSSGSDFSGYAGVLRVANGQLLGGTTTDYLPEGKGANKYLTAENLASTIHSAESKTTPADADEVGGTDTTASYGLKRFTWANIKATLKSAFDTLYAAIGHTHAQLHDRQHSITSAADHTFPGGTTVFLRADGAFAVPPGSSSGMYFAWQPAVSHTTDAGYIYYAVTATPTMSGTPNDGDRLYFMPDAGNAGKGVVVNIDGRGNEMVWLGSAIPTLLQGHMYQCMYLAASGTWQLVCGGS